MRVRGLSVHLWKPFLLIVVFAATLLPLAGNYAIHHPDEQYYTVGAMEMLSTGDWATPRDENGAPRFQKPVLTYWLVAVSYALFGVSALTSRLPFLLAGCAVLGLTFATARDVCGDRRAGTFAMLALLSQPQFVLASLRSMTDVVLTLGILASAFGFLAVLGGRRSRAYFLAAYGGIALAFLSKGLLALLFLLYVFGFVLLDRRRKVAIRALAEPVSLSLALLAVVSWAGVVYAQHGAPALAGFWADQTAARLNPSALRPFWLAPALALSYVVTFLPWSVPAIALWSERVAARVAPHSGLAPPFEKGGSGGISRRTHSDKSPSIPLFQRGRPEWTDPFRARGSIRAFLLGWALLLAALFACARELEEHYLLPAVPFVAIVIGDVLASADRERVGRVLQRSLRATLAVVLVAAALMIWADIQIEGWGASLALLVCLTAVVGAVGVAALGGLRVALATAQALVILLVFPMLFATMRPIALPDQGEQLARRLTELRLEGDDEILFVGKLGTAGKLRVASHGRVRLRRVEHLGEGAGDGYRTIILPREAASAATDDRYRLYGGSHGYGNLAVPRLLAAVSTGRLRDFLARNRNELVILVRAAGDEA